MPKPPIAQVQAEGCRLQAERLRKQAMRLRERAERDDAAAAKWEETAAQLETGTATWSARNDGQDNGSLEEWMASGPGGT